MSSLKSFLISAIIIGLMIFFTLIDEGYIELTDLNPNDYARITDIDYTATVIDEPGSQGKVRVKERITFDVHAASRNNGFWELWRDLPETEIHGV